MIRTYYAQPLSGMTVWEVLRATLEECAADGQRLLAIYRVHSACFSVVVEEAA